MAMEIHSSHTSRGGIKLKKEFEIRCFIPAAVAEIPKSKGK